MTTNRWGDEIVRLTPAQIDALDLLSGEERGTSEARNAVEFSLNPRTRASLVRRGFVDVDGLTGAGYDALCKFV